MTFPDNLLYTKDHEWVKVEGDICIIGVTDFAQKELGDIVYIEVETISETLSKDEVFGTIEAVKTVSDLFLPMSGEIVELNENIEDDPELVNSSPYNEGWIIKLSFSDLKEKDSLLSSEQYQELIGQ